MEVCASGSRWESEGDVEQLLAPEENLKAGRPPIDAIEPGVEGLEPSLVPEAERLAVSLEERRELRLGERRVALEADRSPASLGAGKLNIGKLRRSVEDDALPQGDSASRERLGAPSIVNDGLVR